MSHLQTISDHLPAAMLVVFRLSGLMILGPVFGAAVVPVRVKVFLAFLIGLAVYPLLSGTVTAPAISLWLLVPIIALELMLGLAIGYMASLPLMAVQTGGLIMGQQMGLGFAQFYNPAIDDEAEVMGQMLFFMALAGFLLIGGHEFLVLAVLHSFAHVPLGGFAPDTSLLSLICGMLLAAFELALRVAAPLLALIFLQSIAMGFISKTVPQLNILSLGFPLRILTGFLIVAVGLVVIDEVVMEGIETTLATIFSWIESFSPGINGGMR